MAPSDTIRPRVSQIETPPELRALSGLARLDYVDAFLVEIPLAGERTAEQWARAVLEEAPAKRRALLQSGWAAIGLKLGQATSERSILGWEIRQSTPDLVRLGSDSRIGMVGELLFKRDAATLLFATFVQQDNHVARAVWAATEPVHVPFVRRLLEDAARRAVE